jgi:hypothetical protein
MRFQAEGFNFLADGADLGVRCVRLHDDEHRRIPLRARKFSVAGRVEAGQMEEGRGQIADNRKQETGIGKRFNASNEEMDFGVGVGQDRKGGSWAPALQRAA